MGNFSMPSVFKIGSRTGKVAHEVEDFRVYSLQWKTSGSLVVVRLAVYRGAIYSSQIFKRLLHFTSIPGFFVNSPLLFP